MRDFLWVFLGSGIGGMLRFLIGKYFNSSTNTSIPWGTLLANLLGCLLIGLLVGYFQKTQWISSQWSLLLVTGFCGGFTTFSSFAMENQRLLEQNQFFISLTYILLSIIIGISLVFLGIWIIK